MRRAVGHAHRLTLLGTLAGSIAHEFNNILTPVMSYAEMALDEPADAGLARKALERAYQGCDRASRIAAAILSFAGDGRPGGEGPRCADVAAAVREAMVCLAADPARYGIAVSIEIEPGCRAAMDQVGLQQVLLNLILNAIKAMRADRRGGRLAIRATGRRTVLDGSTWNASGAARDDLVIEVEDTGCGIAPEQLPHIFAPFVSRAAEGARRGTGLGLTICKQLVEGAGGSISVRSQVSVGTCFTIILPPAAAVGEPAPPGAARPAGSGAM